MTAFQSGSLRIAVEGCGHGTLDAIYASVKESASRRGWDGVDLVIIGGDFQAVRNAADLSVMSCPVKYRHLGDFPSYYSSASAAPYLTLFIGGNHEAASHLWELFYGGWVAPNIYYLGAAGVLRIGGLRVAGLSGIWKGHDYRRPHAERLPFSEGDVKSIYHVREIDVRRLLQLRTQVDVGLSHDWPRAVERHGDEARLFRAKPFFKDESLAGTLGSPAAEWLMDRLRPQYWLSAHMHCGFSALKRYGDGVGGEKGATSSKEAGSTVSDAVKSGGAADANPDEIDLDDLDDAPAGNPDEIDLDGDSPQPTPAAPPAEQPADSIPQDLRDQLPASFAKPPENPKSAGPAPGQPVPPEITNKEVRFLALDKCLPGRHYLQLIELEPLQDSLSQQPPVQTSRPLQLEYDAEWLAITRVFHQHLRFGDRSFQTPPDLGGEHYRPLIDKERAWVEENIVQKGKLAVPSNFEVTAPPHVDGHPEIVREQPVEYTSPQTAAFCELLGIENTWHASDEERERRRQEGPPPSDFRGGHGRGGRGGHRGGGGFHGGRGRGRGRGRGGRRY